MWMSSCDECIRLERALHKANEDLKQARAHKIAAFADVGIRIAIGKVANALREYSVHAETHVAHERYAASSDDGNSTSGPVI